MNRFKVAATVFAVAALSIVGNAQNAHAQETTADIDLNLQIENYLNIEVDQPSVTITPTLAEIIDNTVSKTALFNLVNIRSTANYDITVFGNGGFAGDGTISNGDIVLNAGDGDVTVSGLPQNLLTDESGPVNGTSFPVDVTVNNLQNYPVGTHTTTLTFEIVPADGGEIPLDETS